MCKCKTVIDAYIYSVLKHFREQDTKDVQNDFVVHVPDINDTMGGGGHSSEINNCFDVIIYFQINCLNFCTQKILFVIGESMNTYGIACAE